MPISSATLLPPNATALERAIEQAAARVENVPIPLSELWDPDACPIEFLPWLAWALSIDRWESHWTEARKRLEVKRAIALQRIKGTRATIEAVLASFDELLTVVEWFETSPRGLPHTFEVTLPLGAAGGERSTAAFAEAIVRDVTRFKPARSHFRLVQSLTSGATVFGFGAARAAGYGRFDTTCLHDPSPAWKDWLQTEDGEPIQTEDGALIGGAPRDPLGPQAVPAFANGAPWTFDPGCAFAGEFFTAASGTGRATAPSSTFLTPGVWRVAFTVSGHAPSWGTSTHRIVIGGRQTLSRPVNGTYVQDLTIASVSNQNIQLQIILSNGGRISKVSIRKVLA
jgi:phage tail P2-like protein